MNMSTAVMAHRAAAEIASDSDLRSGVSALATLNPAPPAAVTRPLLRWLGGKYRLGPWVISHFPPHRIYLEPYGGAASVLLLKPRAYNEIYNDLDGELVNLFTVLRGPDNVRLLNAVAMTPYARREYELSLMPCREPIDPVERARRMLVRSHMAHGTGGARIDRPSGFRSDGHSGTTNVAGEWADFPGALRAIVERMRGVTIDSRPALDLIRLYDDPKVLIFLDPPYPPDTRSTKSRKGEGYHTYAHEMTVDDHRELLNVAAASRSMIVLSGYPYPLYDERLQGWRRVECAARAHRNSPRTEVLWINQAAVAAMGMGRLL